jgi:hypothetical protein
VGAAARGGAGLVSNKKRQVAVLVKQKKREKWDLLARKGRGKTVTDVHHGGVPTHVKGSWLATKKKEWVWG